MFYRDHILNELFGSKFWDKRNQKRDDKMYAKIEKLTGVTRDEIERMKDICKDITQKLYKALSKERKLIVEYNYEDSPCSLSIKYYKIDEMSEAEIIEMDENDQDTLWKWNKDLESIVLKNIKPVLSNIGFKEKKNTYGGATYRNAEYPYIIIEAESEPDDWCYYNILSLVIVSSYRIIGY